MLVKSLARGVPWHWMIGADRFGTLNGLAAAEKINSSHVLRLLRLTPLAPNIVEGMLDRRQPTRMTVPGLMEPFSGEW